MKKLICCLLALMLVLGTAGALAAGELSVTRENFYVISGYSTYGYAYARVENTGDDTITVNGGTAEIYDENGGVITSTDYMPRYAKTLQPGEYAYVEFNIKIEAAEGEDLPDKYMLTVNGEKNDYYWTRRFPTEARLSLDEPYGSRTRNYMYATVTNDSDEIVYDLSVVLALADEEDNILYLTSERLHSSVGLLPGSSVIIRKEIPTDFTDYYDAHGLKPAKVDAIGYVEN